jgi:carbon-monoxide dehydrogenase large subunit
MQGTGSVFGQSIPRLEDDALLRGKARFVDDVRPRNALEAAFLRSGFAHARIISIDTTSAKALPGVHAVLTMQDIRPHLNGEKLALALPSSSFKLEALRPVLADTEVAYVGEAVAVVIADDRYIAEDAAGLIEVEYDPLPAVSDCREAVADGAPTAHSDLPHNVVAAFRTNYGDCNKVFAPGVRTIRESFWQHRGGSHSLEGRGAVAAYDSLQNRLTVWSSTQSPHAAQRFLCDLLRFDQDQVRVITPDIGGGFGPKAAFYPEDLIVSLGAILIERPVRWTEDRREHFVATAQERDQYWDLEIAFDDEARILGLRGTLLHDQGAYILRGINVAYGSAITVPLPYNIPAYDLDVRCVLTNKVPGAAVRGAGQPQAAFVMERLLDRVAQELGLDRAEVRSRNLVQANQMPCRKELPLRGGTNVILDSGDYPATQHDALERAGWKDFPARQAEARAQGRYIGIGLANYVESTGRGPFEPVTVRVGQDSKIYVSSSATAMGQSTKTMLAQIVAEQIGGDPSNLVVTTGDTATSHLGFGGFNSRQTVVAGSSAYAAAINIREKILKVAEGLLEVAAGDLEILGNSVSLKGARDHKIKLGAIAKVLSGAPGYRLPDGVSPGLEQTEQVVIDDMAFSNGSAVAEVEVDIETGAVRILRFVLAHDCGRIVNPMIVDGQLVGGIAHGIGNALFEWMGFDDQAQPITTNYGEYLLVTAPEMPPIEIIHRSSTSPLNPIGVKGVGESGVIPTPAAVISAVENALSPFGVRLSRAPLAPADIIAALPQRA